MKQELITLAEQIDFRELNFAGFILSYSDSNTTIAITKGSKGMAIKYDFGSDTYTITKNTIRGFNFKEEVLENVYFEDLKGLIQDFFKFEYVMRGLTRG